MKMTMKKRARLLVMSQWFHRLMKKSFTNRINWPSTKDLIKICSLDSKSYLEDKKVISQKLVNSGENRWAAYLLCRNNYLNNVLVCHP